MVQTLPAADTLDHHQLLRALRGVQRGDFTVRLPVQPSPGGEEIAEAFNAIVVRNAQLVGELERVGKAVGREGKIGQRVTLAGATGGCATCVDAVNTRLDDLSQPTVEITRVLGAWPRATSASAW
jgi:hypothetical protein